MPDFSDIHAVLCREKRVMKRVIATAPISDGRIRRLWSSTDLTLIRYEMSAIGRHWAFIFNHLRY